MISILSHKKIRTFLIIAFWLLVWQLMAVMINRPLLLPTPWSTLKAFVSIVLQWTTWNIIFLTGLKILVGYLTALMLGIVLAPISYKYSIVAELLSPVILFIKSIPVASIIVLVLAWLRADNISVFITAFVVFPIVYSQLYASMKNIDINLLEMCEVFGVSDRKKLHFLYVPVLLESLSECVMTTMGLAVRAAVAAELIGIPVSSIGEAIYKTKLYFDIAELFAWTVLIILLCFVMEKGMKKLVHFLKRSLCD